MRHDSRYSIGATPSVRVKRSKNADRDSAAVLASCSTVHAWSTRACICFKAGASRSSPRPRSSPAGALPAVVDRIASMSSIPTSRASIDSLPGCRAVNLGTGSGSSVLQVVAAASEAVGRPLPHRIGPRRAGDVPASFADPALAAELLGWRAERTLPEMCADAWRWQSQNPEGYPAG